MSTPLTKPLILHVINDLSIGGAELLLINTLKILPEFQHVVVYFFPNSDLAETVAGEGAEVICLGHKGRRDFFSSTRKLRKIVKTRKPVLVHSHLFYCTICARLAVPASVPLVSTLHSLYSKDAFGKNIKSLLAARLTLRKRHTLIAVSACVLHDYLRYIPFKGKHFILHNFLPDSSFQKRKDPQQDGGVKLVAVGNLKDAKNYRYLLDIFEHLKHMNITLDIYGKGPLEEELAAVIREKKLNVRLCGAAIDVSLIFPDCHFFIQASSHEGFGLSVIEAMATGLPVILSDIPVFQEVTNGFANFFPLDDALRAAQIVNAAVADPKSHLLAESAFQYVKTAYSTKPYRQKLLSIYEEVARKKLPTQSS